MAGPTCPTARIMVAKIIFPGFWTKCINTICSRAGEVWMSSPCTGIRREATRWTTPSATTPTYKAMKMYRNYDGNKSTFGDISVSDNVPDPDTLSSFAAIRSSDGALTVMIINKSLSGSTLANVSLNNFSGSGLSQVWQLTSANVIT